MSAISDYSSVLEIGFGLNIALSYINLFVNPVLAKAQRESDRFRWWVENPDQLGKVVTKKLDLAAFEEAMSEWAHEVEALERTVEKHRKGPIIASVIVAIAIIGLLMFPETSIPAWGKVFLIALCFGPAVFGSMYLWCKSAPERKAERAACRRANALFSR